MARNLVIVQDLYENGNEYEGERDFCFFLLQIDTSDE